jgi:hypothetical protein
VGQFKIGTAIEVFATEKGKKNQKTEWSIQECILETIYILYSHYGEKHIDMTFKCQWTQIGKVTTVLLVQMLLNWKVHNLLCLGEL